MPKRFEKLFVDIERSFLKFVNGGIRAQNFQVEAVTVECDDVRKLLKLRNKFFSVFLEPAAKPLVLVPRYCDSYAEPANIGPSALDLMRQSERLDIQIDFSIK